MQGQHAAQRIAERDYTPEQVYETAEKGDIYPDTKGRATVRVFKYDSIGHPGTRRRIVANTDPPQLITVLPREEKPVIEKTKQKPSNTKQKKREQLAKKRARSSGT
jgi:hypothetical protein